MLEPKRSAVAAVVAIAALAGPVIFGASVALPQEEPQYYVDGARPEEVAGPISEDQLKDICVPWSKDRSDVLICGVVPEDFEPGPPPGVYPEVCALAEVKYASERAAWAPSLTPEQLEAEFPEIDPSSCWVIPTSSSGEDDPAAADYYVTFEPINVGAEPVSVPLDTDGGNG